MLVLIEEKIEVYHLENLKPPDPFMSRVPLLIKKRCSLLRFLSPTLKSLRGASGALIGWEKGTRAAFSLTVYHRPSKVKGCFLNFFCCSF